MADLTTSPAKRSVATSPTAANAHGEFRARFLKQRFFGSLDGLRAISILGVIWHHSAAPFFADTVPLVHEGNRGVNLFFVISAFLISTLLIRAKDRGTLNVPRFWIRRALRILPLYYAMLVLYIVLAAAVEHDPAVRAGFFAHLPYFASFTSNWFVNLDSTRVMFFFAWSLAAEEQFYVCWPWVERSLRGFRPAFVALAALLVTQAAGYCYQAGGREILGLRILSSVPAAILVGVVLAHALHTRIGFRITCFAFGRRGSAVAAAALTLGALWAEPHLGMLGEVVVATALTMLVAACVIREDNDLAVFLRLRPVAWVGTVSYGVYLMNTLCIGAVRAALARGLHHEAPMALFVFASILTIIVASVSYLTYEKFFLRMKERWFGERGHRDAKNPAVVAPDTTATAKVTVATS